MLSRRDEIEFSATPVFNYITGEDSIYLCNPIQLDGGYTCLHVAAYGDVIPSISPTMQAVIISLAIVAYHITLLRLFRHAFA